MRADEARKKTNDAQLKVDAKEKNRILEDIFVEVKKSASIGRSVIEYTLKGVNTGHLKNTIQAIKKELNAMGYTVKHTTIRGIRGYENNLRITW